jgi:signal transduction histidine kinase
MNPKMTTARTLSEIIHAGRVHAAGDPRGAPRLVVKSERDVNDAVILTLGVATIVAVALVTIRLQVPRSARSPRAEPVTQRSRRSQSETRAVEIVDRISEGVVVLDSELTPLLVNSSARRNLGLQGPGLPLRLPPLRLPSQDVLEVARRAAGLGEGVEEIVSLWFPSRTELRVRAMPLAHGGEVLVLLEDVTEELRVRQIRTEFVSHASHELKSPIAGLHTLAEAVQEAIGDDPPAAARFSEKMIAESTRLGRLIDDLLDLSRLEEATRIPDETVSLSSVAQKEVERMGPTGAAKGVTLEASISPDVLVKGDDQQLALMVRNLLDNAVRYTSGGGRVEIAVFAEGDSVVLRVSDTGMGIPREAQARVFERFYRVDRARSRERGGTGLGLAIVKHVAELHGGRVDVTSELGEGSVFTARLPSAGLKATGDLKRAAG